MNLRIFPPEEVLCTTVEHLPLSKSISARALVLGALTPGAAAIEAVRLAQCDDIEVLQQALGMRRGTVSARLSGTALRFLTAYFAVIDGCDITLTGEPRLLERPLGPLVDALRSLGADIAYEGRDGYAPLHIRGRRLQGGSVSLDARASSQYASALAMAGATMEQGLRIDLGGQIPSMPYLKMTLQMMAARGIDADIEGYTVVVPPGVYRAVEAECEPDWSAASYWYAIAAVSAGWVTLPGMKLPSLQGDSILATLGRQIGVLTGPAEDTPDALELSATPDMFARLDADLSDYPDLVPALAVAAALVGMPFSLTGLANLRIKESDRLEALRHNLLKLGIVAQVTPSSIGWEGERVPLVELPAIDTFNDHRMAMAFAAAAIFIPGIVINDAQVVAKSYPAFFDDLQAAGFTVADAVEPLPADQ